MTQISRAAPNLPAAIQTDEVAHVSVDVVTSGTNRIYGHTADLGSNHTAWELSATLVAGPVAAGSVYAWGGRQPDTEYHFAVVRESGGVKTLEDRISFTTGPAKPTTPLLANVDANTVRGTWDDSTGGAYPHQVFYRRGSQPASGFKFAGTIPAGTDPLTVDVTNLEDGPDWVLALRAWDGGDRYSGLTAAATAAPSFIDPGPRSVGRGYVSIITGLVQNHGGEAITIDSTRAGWTFTDHGDGSWSLVHDGSSLAGAWTPTLSVAGGGTLQLAITITAEPSTTVQANAAGDAGVTIYLAGTENPGDSITLEVTYDTPGGPVSKQFTYTVEA